MTPDISQVVGRGGCEHSLKVSNPNHDQTMTKPLPYLDLYNSLVAAQNIQGNQGREMLAFVPLSNSDFYFHPPFKPNWVKFCQNHNICILVLFLSEGQKMVKGTTKNN